MMTAGSKVVRVAVVAGVIAAVNVGGAVLTMQAAHAAGATPPAVQQRNASTATTDALPTVQIDKGVVWSQAIVGNTVYAGGSFTNARPAGAAPGVGLVPRSNLLAYNLQTGALISSFAPTFNGQIKVVRASPDGTRLYVGGVFTTVNGATHSKLAAFSTATGQLISTFKPQVGGSFINALAVTNTTVYVGGRISAANGVGRKSMAAFDVNGNLLGWAPITDAQVDAMVMTPTGDKVIIGGRFSTVNNQPQRGLAALSPVNGSILPWAAPHTVIDGDTSGNAGIFALSADGDRIYGTGWVYADITVGNLEGAFSADPDTGNIVWLEDCHGDTYDAYSDGTNVYTVSHAHDCSGDGGFPEKDPNHANLHHAVAFTKAVEGTLVRSDRVNSIYKNWAGQPAPAIINWFPDFVDGSFTGQNQAAWTITGSGDYVVAGGEFPSVNGKTQQGLVRFARSTISGAKDGPRLSGTKWPASVSSPTRGTARVSVPTNYDRDDLNLTYQLRRNGSTTPIYTTTVASVWWSQPTLTFTNTGLAAGTYSYQWTALDGNGNAVKSNTVSITIAGSFEQPANVPPTAAFTSSTASRTVTFDSSGSADPDGSITGYLWNFGSGAGTSTAASPVHIYSADGTYTVTLTVTDNSGATTTVSHPVTVPGAAGPAAVAADAFERTTTSGWGSADTGGAWTVSGQSIFKVSNGSGRVTLNSAGTQPTAKLKGVSATNTLTTVDVGFDSVPTGSGTWAWLGSRQTASGEYQLAIKVLPTSTTVYLRKLVGSTTTVLVQKALAMNYATGDRLRLAFLVTGTGPTQLSGKVWKVGTTEPTSYQLAASDSQSGLQGAGGAGLTAYLSSTSTVVPVVATFDNLAIH